MAATKLTINSNGSVKIDGDFEIVDMQGNAYGLQGRTIVSICRCGLSANKPFCDGSHAGTDVSPHRFKAERSEAINLCGCKQTMDPPFCDGTHNVL